jgi:hypothetical protein
MKDYIKEVLGFLKVLFTISIVTEISLVTWITSNMGHTLIVYAFIVGLLLLACIAIFGYTIVIRLNELKEIK